MLHIDDLIKRSTTKNQGLKAIRKSIKHWTIDIRYPLMHGGRIVKDLADFGGGEYAVFRWKGTEKGVPIKDKDCALCIIYHLGSCHLCPLFLSEGKNCTSKNSVYSAFINDPTKEKADKMISALVKAYGHYQQST